MFATQRFVNGLNWIRFGKVGVYDEETDDYRPLTKEEKEQVFSKKDITLRLPIHRFQQLSETIQIKGPVTVEKLFERIKSFYKRKIPARHFKKEKTGYDIELWADAKRAFEKGENPTYSEVICGLDFFEGVRPVEPPSPGRERQNPDFYEVCFGS